MDKYEEIIHTLEYIPGIYETGLKTVYENKFNFCMEVKSLMEDMHRELTAEKKQIAVKPIIQSSDEKSYYKCTCGSIAKEIVSLIPKHHAYLEPFFGSGAVFFNKQPSNIEMINDMDNDVCNLFECIRNDSEKLARIVMTIPFGRQEYDNAFEGLEIEPYMKAAQFLTRCWQGHGFRTNGYKVGWKNDVQGRERMYALWDWYRLPEWIIEIAERLRKAQIENRPALEVVKRFNFDNVFMYLDPPYVLSTRTGKQYKYEMEDSEHEELLKEITCSKAKILVSGYESELYSRYLSGWCKKDYSATAEYGLKRKETIWANFDIREKQEKQQSIFDYIIDTNFN